MNRLIPVLLLTLLMLLPLAPEPRAQKHAPTLEQCEADARAWVNVEDAKAQPVDELKLRMNGMMACGDAYPQEKIQFAVVALVALGTVQDREENFINRHGLYPQFEEEDKQGKR
jgi:hypothetical protein